MSTDERAARYSDLFGGGHQHSENCAYCPFCSAIGLIRHTRPEVLDHLANAAKELLAAASIVLEDASEVIGSQRDQQSAPAERPADPKIRHIDVV